MYHSLLIGSWVAVVCGGRSAARHRKALDVLTSYQHLHIYSLVIILAMHSIWLQSTLIILRTLAITLLQHML